MRGARAPQRVGAGDRGEDGISRGGDDADDDANVENRSDADAVPALSREKREDEIGSK